MDTISISDSNSDVQIVSKPSINCETSLLCYNYKIDYGVTSSKNCCKKSLKLSNPLETTSQENVISISSESCVFKDQSKESTERCPVTWKQSAKKKKIVEVDFEAVEDFFTPSPRNKVSSWIEGINEIYEADRANDLKLPFTEVHLDSLTASVSNACVPINNTRSSILIRQDYKKEADKNFEISSNISFKSRIQTPVTETSASSCDSESELSYGQNCDEHENAHSKSTEMIEKVEKCRKNDTNESKAYDQDKSKFCNILRNINSQQNVSPSLSGSIIREVAKCIEDPEENYKKVVKNANKKSEIITFISQSSVEVQNSCEPTVDYSINKDLCIKKCNNAENKQKCMKNSTKLKSKLYDEVPLSPESQKKNELCSYLQLMNMNLTRREKDGMFQNRRSTRVRHLAQLSEKRELERKLNSKLCDKKDPKTEQNTNGNEIIDITSPDGTKQDVMLTNNSSEITAKNELHLKYSHNIKLNSAASLDAKNFLQRNYFTEKCFNELSINYKKPKSPVTCKQTNGKKLIDEVITDDQKNKKAGIVNKQILSSKTSNFDDTMQHFLRHEKITTITKPKEKPKKTECFQREPTKDKKNNYLNKSIKTDFLKNNSDKRKIKLKEKQMVNKDIRKLNGCIKTRKSITKKQIENNVNNKKIVKPKTNDKKKDIIVQKISKMRVKNVLADSPVNKRMFLRNKTINVESARKLSPLNKMRYLRSVSLRSQQNLKPNQSKLISRKSDNRKRINEMKNKPKVNYIKENRKNVSAQSKLLMKKNDAEQHRHTNNECDKNKRVNSAIEKIEYECNDKPNTHNSVQNKFNTGTNSCEMETETIENNLEDKNSINLHNLRYKMYLKLKLESVKADIDLLENLTPEHRKALFESKKFANVTPKVNTFTNETPLKTIDSKCLKNFVIISNTTNTNQKLSKTENSNDVLPFHGFNHSEVCSNNQKMQETYLNMRNFKIGGPATGESSHECYSENDTKILPGHNNFVNGLLREHSYLKNDSDSLSGVNGEYNEDKTDVVTVEPIELSSIDNDPQVEVKVCQSLRKSVSQCEQVPETNSLQVNQQRVVNSCTVSPAKCVDILPSSNESKLSLQKCLSQSKRRLFVDDNLNAQNWDDNPDIPKSHKSERKSVRTHTIQLAADGGDILNVYYLDFNLIIVQEYVISFWVQSPLGNMLGAQDMWIPNGQVQRLVLDSECVHKDSSEMVVSLENSIAYIELWTKEHKSEKRERPVADIFATIYFWSWKRHGIDKKVLQLENIKGHAQDVQYVVLKRSRNVIVSWSVLEDDVTTTLIHCYQLAPDYQTVSCNKAMKPINHYISSLHNIEDCDTLVVGFGETKLTLWNVEYGYVIVTIDLLNSVFQPKLLWTKCDRGFLFVLRHLRDGNLQLIAINGINYSWKPLQIYELPSADYQSLRGVCVENGLVLAFYKNGLLCWRVQTGELLFEGVLDEDMKYLPCGNHVVTVVNDEVCIKHALQYVIAAD